MAEGMVAVESDLGIGVLCDDVDDTVGVCILCFILRF